MAKKMINREIVCGRVYDHKLVEKVTGETSKVPGTVYIGGSIDVATDDDCLNVVTVNFTYVTATTKAGGANSTFSALKKIIDGGKTVIADGKENATMVKIDTALALNDFYTNRNGETELVSAKRNEGGFVTITNAFPEERNKFEFDILINGTRVVEANPEKGIEKDYLVVKGAVFNFRNAIMPVELVVKNDGGIKYFESLDASPANMVFTRVWGTIESQTIVNRVEEDAAFGEASVKEYTKTVREWVISGAQKEPYDFGDETVLTTDEVKTMLSDREVYLADVKKRQDEYQASKAASNSAFGATPATATAASGGFNF